MPANVVTKKTICLLEAIGRSGVAKNFYLAGGTSLALQINHRRSIDLDFFSFAEFDIKKLEEKLKKIEKLRIDSEEKGTLHCRLNGVRVSFLLYPYQLLFPKIKSRFGVALADKRDISAMKISAIAGRGEKKDFIDIYFLLAEYDLKYLLELFNRKYRGIKYNRSHILKSLVYFEDADKQAAPKMVQNISWRKVKEKIIREVKNYATRYY